MLKLLLRLWWLQQRRNFHWRDAVVGGYIILLYVVMGVSFFISFTKHGGELSSDDTSEILGAALVVGMLLPDIVLKMIMKRDITAMDDYIKSRPVPEKIWNRFLLTTNLISFWNYVLPVLMLPVLLFLLPIPQAVGSFFLLLVFSYIDGVYITCYRKATEFMLKWPLVLGWIGMYILLIGYLMLFSWTEAWMFQTGLLVLALAVLGGLTVYLCNLKIYSETKRKTSHFHGFNHINLFSLQYIGTMRAKRVRNMVILVTAAFLFDSYLFAFMDRHEGMGQMYVFYVVGSVLLPSMVLSQWTFGVEANYFHGLMTKPVKIEQLLQNCFYFYIIVSAVALVFVIPFLFIGDEIGVSVLIGAFCLAVFLNLFNLPTCLFSSRLEIFQTSMFSMQGANLKINLYAAAFLLPLGILVLVYKYVGEMAWCITCVALAVISVAIHRWVIAKIAIVFNKRRYLRMEKFMS